VEHQRLTPEVSPQPLGIDDFMDTGSIRARAGAVCAYGHTRCASASARRDG